MGRQRYTRELLESAARNSRSWDEAVRFCGAEPTRYSKRYLSRKMTEAGIDVSHFRHSALRHTEEALRAAVSDSHSFRDVVRRLGINNVGGNQAHISRRIAALGIDTSHFAQPKAGPKGARGNVLALRSPEEGRIPGERLRRELLRVGVSDRCAMCGCTDWQGNPVQMEVDHINGDWWDNRPENLRLLCPNCHAVTDTYRGRKRRSARADRCGETELAPCSPRQSSLRRSPPHAAWPNSCVGSGMGDSTELREPGRSAASMSTGCRRSTSPGRHTAPEQARQTGSPLTRSWSAKRQAHSAGARTCCAGHWTRSAGSGSAPCVGWARGMAGQTAGAGDRPHQRGPVGQPPRKLALPVPELPRTHQHLVPRPNPRPVA